jgi:hypothetical protein
MRARESEEDMRKKCVLDTDTKFVFVFFGTFSAKKFETHKKLSLFFFSLFLPKREEIQKKKIERRVLSRARRSPLKKHKKTGEKGENERSSPPRERDEREEERSGHHTSHAQQHTISSWHSDKP